jgi:enoyl-[acyl-carrier protein] reductase I
MGLLEGRRALVVGVANRHSTAWGIAQALDREGAALALTYHRERSGDHIQKLSAELSRPVLTLPLDVSSDASLAQMAEELGRHWDRLDIVVHSVAHAKTEELAGRFVDTSRDGWALAQDVSAYSLVALTRAVLPLLERSEGGSVLALSYMGSLRVLPNYNVMGTAKASLESAVRYLAHDLGPSGIRVNAISPGAINTVSARGVKGFVSMLHTMEEQAPLRRTITTGDVGNAAVFLGSEWARNITGQILMVDAGHHIMGI